MNSFPQQPLVLVIDDEPEVLGQVAAVLGGAGYATRCCGSPDAALELARGNTPDLIISDVNPGGQSGLELCERMKADPALADVPVMFLSATQIPDIIRRSDSLGGTYHLRKPFDSDVLMELVDKALWVRPHVGGSHLGQRAVAVQT